MSVPERYCAQCGEITAESIDPLPCPRCGTMLWDAVVVVPAKVEKSIQQLHRQAVEQAIRARSAEAKADRMANARTRSNVERGAENVAKILAMKEAGKSIAETARDLDLSPGYVASVRGKARGETVD